jgi:hypothetical protein
MSGLGMMEVAQINAQQSTPINVNFKSQKQLGFDAGIFLLLR